MDTLIHFIADGLMIPIILLAAYALIFKVSKTMLYDTYTHILMAGLTSYMIAKFVAVLWQPEIRRPFEIIGAQPGAAYLNNPGFPSDHALFAGFLTLAVWYGTRNRKITALMLVMTAFVCIGRVLALVHTPLDVAGGLVMASLGAVWYVDSKHKHFKLRLAKNTNK